MTALGFGLAGPAPEATVLAAAQAAEQAGYRTFWLNHPPTYDALPKLGRVARAVPIAIATGVIPISARTPGSILEGMGEAGLPTDRFRLGIGSGFGPEPLGRVREAIPELRAGTSAEVVLAALRPRMCALVGQLADAVLLSQLTPEGGRERIRQVHEAADQAGRPRPRIYVYVRTALGAPGIAALEQEAEGYTKIPVYAASYRALGTGPLDAAVRATTPEQVRAGLAGWAGLADEVVIRAITADDAPDDVLAILEAARGTF
jgi:alkanesulfonate monooxygenase SsuD/methylene tetrahydromethanopterin reductase-like flavin-dependent oxidoreductase (luciferase family)